MARRSASWGLVGLLSVLAGAGEALAAHPFTAEDTGTVGEGLAELTLVTAVRGDRRTELGGLDVIGAVHLGLLEQLDLGAEFGFAWGEAGGGRWQSGAGAPVVDLKWRLADGEGAWPSVVAKATWSPPQTADGDEAGHGFGLIVALGWAGARWELGIDGAVEGCAGAESGHAPAVRASATALWQAEDRVQLGLEVTARAPSGAAVGAEVLAGLRAQPSATSVASLGVGTVHHAGGQGWMATVAWTQVFGGAPAGEQ